MIIIAPKRLRREKANRYPFLEVMRSMQLITYDEAQRVHMYVCMCRMQLLMSRNIMSRRV